MNNQPRRWIFVHSLILRLVHDANTSVGVYVKYDDVGCDTGKPAIKIDVRRVCDWLFWKEPGTLIAQPCENPPNRVAYSIWKGHVIQHLKLKDQLL